MVVGDISLLSLHILLLRATYLQLFMAIPLVDSPQSGNVGGSLAGQCFCKENVMGLTCDICRVGFFNLSSESPSGCDPCACNTAGTFDAATSCSSDTGQCLCKTNTAGLKCDQCRSGTTSLNPLNPLGCSDCTCNSTGSVSNNCNGVTGACPCKPGVGGAQCSECLPGYFGFSNSGCQPCACHPNGSVSSTDCDSSTGRCSCLPNVVGGNCDGCEVGFFDIAAGCLSCGCEAAGSVNSSSACDASTGQCGCRANVEGLTCNACRSGFTGLSDLNPSGCVACDCFTPNTDTTGLTCDPVTAECDCIATATGMMCDTCVDGFYFDGAGCPPCNCNVAGSANSTCDAASGQCVCSSVGVAGRQCDICQPGFFQYPE